MAGRCAVLGVGQTKHAARRDVGLGGLVREAAQRALDDAGLGWGEIDAVVLGKGPDIMEGLMSPELLLVDALSAGGKPIHRAYTSGNAGGMTASMGVSLIAAGLHSRVLVVAFEKQSEAAAAGSTLQHYPFEARWQGGTGSLFGAICREYLHRSGAPMRVGDLAALKDRLNAVRNPYAQVRRPDVTLEAIAGSKMLWDPIRLLHSSPSSDGACALVLGDEGAARGRKHLAWVHGCAVRTEPPSAPLHDNVNPRAGQTARAPCTRRQGLRTHARQLDLAELFVPYSWIEPMLLENLGFAPEGRGWQLVDEGRTAIDGDLPVNPSGGLLGANPIGAAGLIRFAEAALQVQGRAGDHQIDGARLALGHAAGGYSNCVAMWVVGRVPALSRLPDDRR